MPDAAPLPASATQPAWDKLAALAAAPWRPADHPALPGRPPAGGEVLGQLRGYVPRLLQDLDQPGSAGGFVRARPRREGGGFHRTAVRRRAGKHDRAPVGHAHGPAEPARRRLPRAVLPEGGFEDASKVAAHERQRMEAFVRGVHDGSIAAADGKPFTDVLNIGIGGSDLGPRMVSTALTWVHGAKIEPHFLSNVDGHAFAQFARELDPARTLVLVASKTFTTLETMTNGHAARDWLAAALGRGCRASPLCGAFDQSERNGKIRHPRGARLRLQGLGGRPLLGLVVDRPFRGARRRLRTSSSSFSPAGGRWMGISGTRHLRKICRRCWR